MVRLTVPHQKRILYKTVPPTDRGFNINTNLELEMGTAKKCMLGRLILLGSWPPLLSKKNWVGIIRPLGQLN